nr:ABC transporter ATP-binding protein [Bowdeniella massiliensis]
MSTMSSSADSRIALAGRNLTKVYGSGESAVRALSDVSLDIPPGQFTAIMGPSGSGKSTLLHILAGLEEPTSGHVEVSGANLTTMSENERTELRRDHIGFVFQSYNLVPHFSARQNITLPLDLAGRTINDADLTRITDALSLTDRLEHLPSELSGGQQQRTAIARALITDPDVIMADEPTGNLDNRTSAEVLSLLRSAVREFGQTLVLVTHDPMAAAYADNVLLLTDGTIAGTVEHPSYDSVVTALDALRAVNSSVV